MSSAILFEQPYRGDVWRLEVATHEGRTFGNWRKWYRDGAKHPRKHLPAARNFIAWLDDIANASDARPLPRHRHRQRNILNPRVLAHQREQLPFIDLKHLVLVRETMA